MSRPGWPCRAASVNLGDDGNELLARRIRAHGNFFEYVPVALLLTAFAEYGGAPHILIYVLGVALVIGRAAHGFAPSSLTRHPVARVLGMAFTFPTIGVGAVTCLIMALTG